MSLESILKTEFLSPSLILFEKEYKTWRPLYVEIINAFEIQPEKLNKNSFQGGDMKEFACYLISSGIKEKLHNRKLHKYYKDLFFISSSYSSTPYDTTEYISIHLKSKESLIKNYSSSVVWEERKLLEEFMEETDVYGCLKRLDGVNIEL